MVKNVNKVRIPSFIVIIASFVTIVELVMQGFIPALFDQLGLFIPLIVVNCVVLGRLLHPKTAFFRPLLMPAWIIRLTILGAVRELLGSGAIFGMKLIDGDGMLVFVLPPEHLLLGYLIALMRKITKA